MFCSKCGKELVEGTRFCGECGTQFGPSGQPEKPTNEKAVGTRDQGRKSGTIYPGNRARTPHLCWLNLLVAGLAQMIHGQIAKGLVILALAIFSNLVLPVILALFIIVASIVDAFMVGRTLKKGIPVGKWAWFPRQ